MRGRLTKGTVIFLSVLILISIGVFSLAEKNNIVPSPEKISPSDWIKQDQIKVYSNKIVIDLENATWASFTNTNSMDPFIDENTHAIEVLPESPNLIEVGDVISYRTDYGTIIHRVVEKGQDLEGVYYIVKGDNNPLQDSIKVRYSDIKGVVVAVIY